MATLLEVAARHPNLVQLAYYQGQLEAWTVDDPSTSPETWVAQHHATPADVPDAALAALAADLAELRAELDAIGEPVVWHLSSHVEEWCSQCGALVEGFHACPGVPGEDPPS